MKPTFTFDGDTCTLTQFNQARPFSSFLPGIAGEYGKPMWVFYTNRGQCISCFGIRNKNGAMVEFYPANKAYEFTPLLGFRTFIHVGKTVYEPFHVGAPASVSQVLKIRPAEIELEETNAALGLRTRVVFYGIPNEARPVLMRSVTVENIGRKTLSLELWDGLPQIVPFGLNEGLLKQMSRTMEAFAEVLHTQDDLPLFKLKVEPSDRPEVQWIEGGFFSFTQARGKSCPIRVDAESLFGSDTSFQFPQALAEGVAGGKSVPLTARFGSAFSTHKVKLAPKASYAFQSYYGHADRWELASAFRRRVEKDPAYGQKKRVENQDVTNAVMDRIGVHSAESVLDAYSRQTFLDNTLRGGQPMRLGSKEERQVFHYYSRKHGDMERDYNFFELSPSYFSQGNGNFRDVNQNRRSENFSFPNVGAANVETFFNLLQLDGFNPLVIQYEKFFLKDPVLAKMVELWGSREQAEWRRFLAKPFSPGELYEKLLADGLTASASRERFEAVLIAAQKIQDASFGEGYWVDHWTYNLDLLENFAAVYPDRLNQLLIVRRDFTYYESDHVVQPRSKKHVLRPDGRVRQSGAVVSDPEKATLLSRRAEDPFKVRVDRGQGAIYRTSLLAKILGLIAVKAASLDPFGIGLEMEADKPGWCDALNGLPALFGSSVNESFELLRWVRFLETGFTQWWPITDTKHAIAEEVADLVGGVSELLGRSAGDSFFATWDALATLKEAFRERTRLGVSGRERTLARVDIENFLKHVRETLTRGLRKSYLFGDLCATYFTHEAVEFDRLPAPPVDPLAKDKPLPAVKVRRFKQIPVSPFLEGAVHALRTATSTEEARRMHRAVRSSDLYDRPLGMYRLNVPLQKESFEIGRGKIFPPGWLENESIFLHMHYKFMLEILRSGLVDEFFNELKKAIVPFQKPAQYGRSILENSSFIASSRFADPRFHGTGFVARLTGATAEWLSILYYLTLGREPFRIAEGGALQFAPQPLIPGWLFTTRAEEGVAKNSFGLKIFGSTWLIYENASRHATWGTGAAKPSRFVVKDADGKETVYEGSFLPEAPAKALREGRLARVVVTLS